MLQKCVFKGVPRGTACFRDGDVAVAPASPSRPTAVPRQVRAVGVRVARGGGLPVPARRPTSAGRGSRRAAVSASLPSAATRTVTDSVPGPIRGRIGHVPRGVRPSDGAGGRGKRRTRLTRRRKTGLSFPTRLAGAGTVDAATSRVSLR